MPFPSRVAQVFADEWPQLVATLTRDLGDLGLAEEAAAGHGRHTQQESGEDADDGDRYEELNQREGNAARPRPANTGRAADFVLQDAGDAGGHCCAASSVDSLAKLATVSASSSVNGPSG